ncbi:hypothetical protein TNCV_4639891 [Trichonephila clavipes]|nr:hypothetical protein TNCV_4639891 [Trichonephila clavipes]
MRRIIPAGFPPSANKKRITVLFSCLMQIESGTDMLNGLLQPNDNEGRRVIVEERNSSKLAFLEQKLILLEKPRLTICNDRELVDGVNSHQPWSLMLLKTHLVKELRLINSFQAQSPHVGVT